MHQVNLFDLITLEPLSSGIEIASNSSGVPLGPDNLAYKAARMILQEYQPGAGVKIFIEKNIPIGAGLAGGSTDAAAVLAGINHLCNYPFSRPQLLKMAAAIGSDVAFCLAGQYFQDSSGVLVSRGVTAIARGRGELLESLPMRFIPYILIVKPDFELSTAQVYSELDLTTVEQFPATRSFLQEWNKGDIINISVYMVNVLESVSIPKKPEIGIIKSRLIEMGALNALMSGSGPSVFAIFPDNETAFRACQAFKKDYQEVYLLSSYKRGDLNGSEKTVTSKS
jgi:4-diphosphocytidyl-2-C-methyl-D-erythritol kinase